MSYRDQCNASTVGTDAVAAEQESHEEQDLLSKTLESLERNIDGEKIIHS